MIGTSKDIKNPGLRILPPGVERYLIKGGGISIFEIFPEDKINILNNEGNKFQKLQFLMFMEKVIYQFLI